MGCWDDNHPNSTDVRIPTWKPRVILRIVPEIVNVPLMDAPISLLSVFKVLSLFSDQYPPLDGAFYEFLHRALPPAISM